MNRKTEEQPKCDFQILCSKEAYSEVTSEYLKLEAEEKRVQEMLRIKV